MKRSRKKVPGNSKVLTIRISLVDSKPPVWRRVQVADTMTMGDLHYTVQIAMGWTNSHLHVFVKGENTYGPVNRSELEGFSDIDEDTVRVGEVLDRRKAICEYLYDFGDDWDHRIELESVDPPDPDERYPVCIAGEQACPLEDSGGIFGYYAILEALQDPEHEDHEEFLEWVPDDFDPDHFDKDAVNVRLDDIHFLREIAEEF